jgi:hypothetical protein
MHQNYLKEGNKLITQVLTITKHYGMVENCHCMARACCCRSILGRVGAGKENYRLSTLLLFTCAQKKSLSLSSAPPPSKHWELNFFSKQHTKMAAIDTTRTLSNSRRNDISDIYVATPTLDEAGRKAAFEAKFGESFADDAGQALLRKYAVSPMSHS